jgi:hypothetical protein
MDNKRRLQKILLSGLMVLGLGWIQKAHAASTDTITLSVTPTGMTYAVQISSVTDGVGYNFGSIALGATTGSTAAIVVRNVGTVYEYFVMKVGNTNPDNWAPVSGVPATDEFRLRGWFTTLNNQPPDASFATAILAGFNANGSGVYNQSAKTAISTNAYLWLQLRMPSTLNAGTGGAQTMTLYVAGQGT